MKRFALLNFALDFFLFMGVILLLSCHSKPEPANGIVQLLEDVNGSEKFTINATWNTKFDHVDFRSAGSTNTVTNQPMTTLEIRGTITNKTNHPIESIKLIIRIEGQSPPFPFTKELTMGGFVTTSEGRGWVMNSKRKIELMANETRQFHIGTSAYFNKDEGGLRNEFLEVTDVYVAVVEE